MFVERVPYSESESSDDEEEYFEAFWGEAGEDPVEWLQDFEHSCLQDDTLPDLHCILLAYTSMRGQAKSWGYSLLCRISWKEFCKSFIERFWLDDQWGTFSLSKLEERMSCLKERKGEYDEVKSVSAVSTQAQQSAETSQEQALEYDQGSKSVRSEAQFTASLGTATTDDKSTERVVHVGMLTNSIIDACDSGSALGNDEEKSEATPEARSVKESKECETDGRFDNIEKANLDDCGHQQKTSHMKLSTQEVKKDFVLRQRSYGDQEVVADKSLAWGLQTRLTLGVEGTNSTKLMGTDVWSRETQRTVQEMQKVDCSKSWPDGETCVVQYFKARQDSRNSCTLLGDSAKMSGLQGRGVVK